MRCIRSRNTFPGFFPLGFTPGFRIGQRIAAVFSVGFFLASCCANFFTYVLPLHLNVLTTVIYIIHFV